MLNSRSASSFWPAYQQQWARLLCDETEGLQAWIEQTIRALARGEVEVPDIAAARGALDDLSARFKRVESLRASAFDLELQSALDAETRAFFTRYGAAILNAGAPLSGESRYGEVRYGEVRGALENLKTWLTMLELAPQVVLGMGDRDSQIIARALALRLKVRYADANGDGLAQSETLIVAADSRAIRSSVLATILPDQVVFAFNLHPDGGTLAPDVVALCQPELVLPWHLETPEADDDGETPPLREASSVAAQIAATRALANPNWPARLEFYRVRAPLLAAGNPRLSRLPMLPEGA